MTDKFHVLFLRDAAEFLDGMEENARKKVLYNIHKARVTNDNELFKKLTTDIWEFRTLFNRTQYRLFAFWDKSDKQETLVIATHGIVKKTGKTPPGDIEKAERLMRLYFEGK